MNQRIGLIGTAAVVLAAVTLFAGLAEGAAGGKVIGMTSGDGNKGAGVVSVSPYLARKRLQTGMTISTPIDNVQVAGDGGGVLGTTTGGQLTATIHDASVSCTTFTTGVTTWTGTGKIVFGGGGTTGTTHIMNLTHYTLTFWRGVSYANEKASVSGDGIKDGTETGIDSFFMPSGFSCSNPGAELKSLSVIGVLKITTP